MSHIMLCGFPRSGKSTIGKNLAALLEKPFFDLDMLLEELYAKQFGIVSSARTIYMKHGEVYFRNLEAALLCQFRSKPSIIALGGGTPLHTTSLLSIKKMGTVVYMNVEKNVLQRRYIDQGRPLGWKFCDSFETFFTFRHSKYTACAQKICSFAYETVDEMVETIGTILIREHL